MDFFNWIAHAILFLGLLAFGLVFLIIAFGIIVTIIFKIRDKIKEAKKDKECQKGNHTYVDGKCSNCYKKAPEHAHDISPSCVCRICGKVLHKFANHKCQRCGMLDHKHDYQPIDGRCTVCGELSPLHKHKFSYSCQCSTCGEYFHKYENGKCRSCGAIDPEHEHLHKKDIYGKFQCICEICGQTIHEYENGRCRKCGAVDPKHSHVYKYGRCTVCYAIDPNHQHIFTSKGSNACKCNICGEYFHCYENGKCVKCGEIDPAHSHRYADGKCIICNKVDPYHEHVLFQFSNSLAKCKICGEYFNLGSSSYTYNPYSESKSIPKSNGLYCNHRYQNGRCEICGKTQPEYNRKTEPGYASKYRKCSGYPHNCSNCDHCRYE